MKRHLLMLVAALSVMGACDRGDGIVDSTAPVPETPDESIVISNCAALEAAALNFAAENPGEVGYAPVCEGDWNVGCVISGVGCEAGTTVTVIVVEPPHVEAL